VATDAKDCSLINFAESTFFITKLDEENSNAEIRILLRHEG
jgi:hypothetical protein